MPRVPKKRRGSTITATRKSIGAKVEAYRTGLYSGIAIPTGSLVYVYERKVYPFGPGARINPDMVAEIVCETGKFKGMPICAAEVKRWGWKKVLTIFTN